MSIDLHIHTTASDGDMDPVTVVQTAAAAGLQVIALADHESTSGYHPASQEGKKYGITVIPGVELLTFYAGREIHLLGYFHDPDNKYLQEGLAELRQQRKLCAEETVRKLAEFGFKLSWPEIEGLVHPGSPISKGHIVQALSRAGFINNRKEAVDFLVKYLNQGGLAYVSHEFPFTSAVRLIRNAGGIPILAHPGLIRDDQIVRELCDLGIDGLEVFYYYFGQHREERIERYRTLAEAKRLLKTGGSDYHGTYTPVSLGDIAVPREDVSEFLKLFDLF